MHFRDWKKSVFRKIKIIIAENEEPVGKGVLDEIKKISERTVKELNSISNQLSEFLTRIGPVDPGKSKNTTKNLLGHIKKKYMHMYLINLFC